MAGEVFRLLVCGGRKYDDRRRVNLALSRKLKLCQKRGRKLVVVEGGAEGADALARRWANTNGVPVETWHAEWERYGPAAGPQRNQYMLDVNPVDLVLAFPGGTGTADMVRRARTASVPVEEA